MRLPVISLPWPVRFKILVPGTLVLTAALGLRFPLPSGPLCDGAMIAFMEGGCDWGRTNEFFFAKVGLLVATNFAFVVCLRRPSTTLIGFVPHLLVLLWFTAVEANDHSCDGYYENPRLNMGQLGFELIGFSLLGIALLRYLRGRPSRSGWIALTAWNVFYVTSFYGWALVVPYWSWEHVIVVTATLLAAAGLTTRLPRSPAPDPAPPAAG